MRLLALLLLTCACNSRGPEAPAAEGGARAESKAVRSFSWPCGPDGGTLTGSLDPNGPQYLPAWSVEGRPVRYGRRIIDHVAWMSTGGAKAGSTTVVLQNHGGQGISVNVIAHSCACIQRGFGDDGLMKWKTRSRSRRSRLAKRAVIRSVDEAAQACGTSRLSRLQLDGFDRAFATFDRRSP